MTDVVSKEEYAKMTPKEKFEYFLKKEKDRNEGEISTLAVALQTSLDDNEAATIMKKMCDGEPVNKNPLTEIPNPKMKLYGLATIFKSAYFDTETEVEEYAKNHDLNLADAYIIEYLGTVAGCSDVIRVTYKNGKSTLETACDEDGYLVYNAERSTYRGEFVWEYFHGNLREEFAAFRDRGIIFEHDIYKEITEKYKQIMDKFEESRQLVLAKKFKTINPD